MGWEDFFDFVSEDDIRIKGTRVGIEVVLWEYLEGAIPEEIVLRYPTLSLPQVYATITYYLYNREAVDAYLRRCQRHGERAWQEQHRQPSAFLRALRKRLRRERQALTSKGSLRMSPAAP